jgi:hypothetical protein
MHCVCHRYKAHLIGVFCGEAAMLYLVARGIVVVVVLSVVLDFAVVVCLSTPPASRGVAGPSSGALGSRPRAVYTRHTPTLCCG